MRFRRKLLLTLGITTFVTAGLCLGVMERVAHDQMFDAYRAKLLSIAATTAAHISEEQLTDAAALRAQLRTTRDANRRDDTRVARLSVIAPSNKEDGVWVFVADPEDDPKLSVMPGETWRSSQGFDPSRPSAETEFVKDEFGTFLHAFAPVRDRAGKTVAVVVAAAAENWVQSLMRPMLIAALICSAMALLIAVVVSLIMSGRISGPMKELHEAVLHIGEGKFDTRVAIRSRDEIGEVAAAVNQMAEGLRERDRVKSTFARYVSQQVMESVLAPSAEVGLSGARRRITVLFSDIRGFTAISENLAPEKVVALLNVYFEAMVDVIFRNKGTLDKFLGDGIMVIFGAPEDDPNQEEHALRTALEMQEAASEISRRWAAEGVDLNIGIGIHSGPAVVGSIGSSRRMDYTAIGDTVNLAARLESATRDTGGGILISEYAYSALKGLWPMREAGSIQVKGRNDPVRTWAPAMPPAREA